MNVGLWVIQGLLALVFTASGTAKAVMGPEQLLATRQTGVVGLPLPFVRFIALCELLGAAGLILPTALGVEPALTPIAAVALAALMICAAFVHTRLREPRNVAINVILLALCLFVARGRS